MIKRKLKTKESEKVHPHVRTPALPTLKSDAFATELHAHLGMLL